MFRLILSFLGWLSAFCRSRNNLGLEILALRQQLAVLQTKRRRPRLSRWDRLFWVVLRRLWLRWEEVLVVVKPETVVSWHRAGFRVYWRFLSCRSETGRPRIQREVRELIRRMAVTHFQGKSWMPQALTRNGIEVQIIDLPHATKEAIKRAQKRQFR
jgi:hypothetical protein